MNPSRGRRGVHLIAAGMVMLTVLAPGPPVAADALGMPECGDDMALRPVESVYVASNGISEHELRSELSRRLAERLTGMPHLPGTPGVLANRIVEGALLRLRQSGAIPSNQVPPYALSEEYLGVALKETALLYGINPEEIAGFETTMMNAAAAAAIEAIPSNAIPSNRLIESLVVQVVSATGAEESRIRPIIEEIFATEAIPSNAIPSNAIPSNLLQLIMERLEGAAIPSNGIPSNLVVTAVLAAIPSNAIPSNMGEFVTALTETVAAAIPSNMTETVVSEILGSMLLSGLPPVEIMPWDLADQLEASLRLAIPSNAIPSNLRALIESAIPSNAIPSNAIPSNIVARLLAALQAAIPSNAIPSNLSMLLAGAAFRAIPSNAIPSNTLPPLAIPSVASIAGMLTQLTLASAANYPVLEMNPANASALGAELHASFSSSLRPGGSFLDGVMQLGSPDADPPPTDLVLAMPATGPASPALRLAATDGACVAVASSATSYGIDCSTPRPTVFERLGTGGLGSLGSSLGRTELSILGTAPSANGEPIAQVAVTRPERHPLCDLLERLRPSRSCRTSRLPDPWKVVQGDVSELWGWWQDGWSVMRHTCGYQLAHPGYGMCSVSIGIENIDALLEDVSDQVWAGNTAAFERLRVLECMGWSVSINDVGYSICRYPDGCKGGIFAIREGTLYGPPIIKQSPPFGWLKSALSEAGEAARGFFSGLGGLFGSRGKPEPPRPCLLCGRRSFEALGTGGAGPGTTMTTTTTPTTTRPGTTQPPQTTTTTSTTTSTTTTTTTTTTGPTRVTVPNVIGMTEAAATGALQARGLQVTWLSAWYSFFGTPNTVWMQDPTSGTEVEPGTTVYLQLTKLPETQSQCEGLGGTWAFFNCCTPEDPCECCCICVAP